MKPVDMRAIGRKGDGDCLMASAASILEISLDELPAITAENDLHWFSIFERAMRERGFFLGELPGDNSFDRTNNEKSPPLAPQGYTIAIGPSPRFDGSEAHAVVCLDGMVVHDPHPSRTGITHVDYWFMLIPVLRTPRAVRQSEEPSPL